MNRYDFAAVLLLIFWLYALPYLWLVLLPDGWSEEWYGYPTIMVPALIALGTTGLLVKLGDQESK